MDTALILSFLGANLLAVLALVLKTYRNGGAKVGNPVNLHDFIVDTAREHQELKGLSEQHRALLEQILEELRSK